MSCFVGFLHKVTPHQLNQVVYNGDKTWLLYYVPALNPFLGSAISKPLLF